MEKISFASKWKSLIDCRPSPVEGQSSTDDLTVAANIYTVNELKNGSTTLTPKNQLLQNHAMKKGRRKPD